MHWSLGGKWEGPRDYVAEKGDPIPWVVQVEGKRVGGLELLLELELGFWVVECGEWIAKRARPPCGLIASARGWLAIERK
jgi:hypothetical protein